MEAAPVEAPRRHLARPATAPRALRGTAAAWFALAVGALAVSGAFSLVLVAGRVPGLVAVLGVDPALALRSLVVHVNLAMGVWFFACIAGLFSLLPGDGRSITARIAPAVALLGVILLIIPPFIASAEPILSNYVSTLSHPLFPAGLVIFAAGILLGLVDRRLIWPGSAEDVLPGDAQYAVRGAAVAFIAAMLTILGALLTQEPTLSRAAYYERLFWGGGHVMQTANTLGMLTAWLVLLRHLTGRTTVPLRGAAALVGLMLLPALAGPWLTFGRHSDIWFTHLMQYGIFPGVIIFLVCGVRSLWRAGAGSRRPPSPAFTGLATSVVMTLAGFVLGAMIVADTTLTPAHYHANIGAVTVAFMTLIMVLLPRRGESLPWPRLARWQPLIYGTGQMLFVLGLAVAGTLGQAPRKVYGQAPQLLTDAERIGFMFVGAGGLLAFGGGVLFLAIVIHTAWRIRAGRA